MREEKLLLFLLRWTRADPTRDQYLAELSRNIIFALMDAAFLQKHVLTSPALKLSKEDVNQEQLLVFGGDSSSSRSILAYNSLTDSWRKLPLELPDPGNSPGDLIQVVSCPASGGIFIKRSINCYWLDWRTKQFSFVGSFQVKQQGLVSLVGSHISVP